MPGRPRKKRSHTWIAYTGDDYAGVLEALDLTPSGKPAEGSQTPAMAVRLPNGWRVILFNDFFRRAVKPDMLEAMSVRGHVLALTEYEGTDEAEGAFAWLHSRGQRVWTVSPSLREGPTELHVDGDVPDVVFRLQAQALQRHKAGVDKAVFDVPALLARAISGFSTDQMDGLAFAALEPVAEPPLPREREEMNEILLESLSGMLVPLGFYRQADADGRDDSLIRHTPEGSQRVILFVWDKDGAVTADLWIEVRDKRVDAIERLFHSRADHDRQRGSWCRPPSAGNCAICSPRAETSRSTST